MLRRWWRGYLRRRAATRAEYLRRMRQNAWNDGTYWS